MPAHRLLPEPLRGLNLSYSVLCYWMDKGYVHGEFDGQGRPRVIPESEHPVIRTMHALVMLGFTAEYAAKYARRLPVQVSFGGIELRLEEQNVVS